MANSRRIRPRQDPQSRNIKLQLVHANGHLRAGHDNPCHHTKSVLSKHKVRHWSPKVLPGEFHHLSKLLDPHSEPRTCQVCGSWPIGQSFTHKHTSSPVLSFAGPG